MYRSLSDRGSFTEYEFVFPVPNRQLFSIQVPYFFLGHPVRPNFRRGRQTLLRSVVEPMSTVVCVLHPPCNQRGLGLHPRSQCPCQQTKYLWSSFRADRTPASQTKRFRTRPTLLDTRQFRRSRRRDAALPSFSRSVFPGTPEGPENIPIDRFYRIFPLPSP